MATLIQVKRGTRAQIDTAASANFLNEGEPYLITDATPKPRLAIGLSGNEYGEIANLDDVGGGGGEVTSVNTRTGDVVITGADVGLGTVTATGANKAFARAAIDAATLTGFIEGQPLDNLEIAVADTPSGGIAMSVTYDGIQYEVQDTRLGNVTATGADAAAARAAIGAGTAQAIETTYYPLALIGTAAQASATVTIGSQVSGAATGVLWTAGMWKGVIAAGADFGRVFQVNSNGTMSEIAFTTTSATGATTFDRYLKPLYSAVVGTILMRRQNGVTSRVVSDFSAGEMYFSFGNAVTDVRTALLDALVPLAASKLWTADYSDVSFNPSGTKTIGAAIPGTVGKTYQDGTVALSMNFGGTLGNLYTLNSSGAWTLTSDFSSNGYRVVAVDNTAADSGLNTFRGTLVLRREGSTRELAMFIPPTELKKTGSASNSYASIGDVVGNPANLTTTAKNLVGALEEVKANAAGGGVTSVNTRTGAVTLTGADVGLNTVTATGANAAAARAAVGAVSIGDVEDSAWGLVYSYDMQGDLTYCQTAVTLGTAIGGYNPASVVWAQGMRKLVNSGANAGEVYQVGSDGSMSLYLGTNVGPNNTTSFIRIYVGRMSSVYQFTRAANGNKTLGTIGFTFYPWDSLTGKPNFIASGATAFDARQAIGAGTSSLALGTTSTTAKAGDYAPSQAELRNGRNALTVSSGVVNIDCSLGNYFTLAPTANVTSITFSNVPSGNVATTIMIRFTQDTTARTVAFPPSFRWEGSAPTVSTGSGAVDVLALTTFDNGTKWDATLSKGRV